MSEIFRNSTQNVFLDIYGGRADAKPTAVVETPSGIHSLTVSTETPLDGAADRYSAILTLADTQAIGEVKVTWNFNISGQAASRVDYFDVVQPLAEVNDIREELELDASDAEIARAERRVRVIIENFTGQTFAPSVETIRVTGSGDYTVRLPKRLIEVTSVDGFVPATSSVIIANGGWALSRQFPYSPGSIVESVGVIVAPGFSRGYRWPLGQSVAITGRWGWDRVPREISEAALILIEDKLSPDSIYQEKYLTSLTSPDWRIQFDGRAFRGTGNVVADQILTAFKVNTAAVI